jgi:hypothetical protein
MTVVVLAVASWMMVGASPPKPKWEISVTAAAKTAATPASVALPPAISILIAASQA